MAGTSLQEPSDGLMRLFDVAWEDEPWRERRACRDTPHGMFFPEAGYSHQAALAVCERCPVKAECLDHAIEWGERGIWGGTNERERRRIRARRTLDRFHQ